MIYYAVVENDIVVNVIVADDGWVQDIPGTLIEYQPTDYVAIGCQVVDGVIIPLSPIDPDWPNG